ncbi:hypothetical protein Dda3937_02199 [Dickeya dadantii 3937]|uniref:Uncharacterized protein n=1 Tax=Dickeya dadantii (strain 3937) TaxID=198628 RepID=E0SLW8_DICD3|nr:hypothetical protein Dda3937_02199 [Dickeya dadantii 3937]
MLCKENIFHFEPTLNQQRGVLNQHGDVPGYFLAGGLREPTKSTSEPTKPTRCWFTHIQCWRGLTAREPTEPTEPTSFC